MSNLDHIRIILFVSLLRPNLDIPVSLLKFEFYLSESWRQILIMRSSEIKIFDPAFFWILEILKELSENLSIYPSHFHEVMRIYVILNRES